MGGFGFCFGILTWAGLMLCYWIGLVSLRFLMGFRWWFCNLVDLPLCFCLVLYQVAVWGLCFRVYFVALRFCFDCLVV